MKKTLVVALLTLSATVALSSPRREMHATSQAGSICGTGVAHCVVLTWTASTSAAGCVSPCAFGYNVYQGSATGAENLATPVNASLIIGISFTVPITLTANPQTFYFVVEAVETSGGVTASSVPSTEVSTTFPGTPTPPVGPSVTGKQ
jgi:hypothetical protein